MCCLQINMVSLTTDTWTSIQNMNYICVKAHYIDEGWELNKKIEIFFDFLPLRWNHREKPRELFKIDVIYVKKKQDNKLWMVCTD